MKNNKVYLNQILDSIDKIKNFSHNFTYQQFSEDQKTQSAVIMQLALIGELAKHISNETKEKIDLPWKEITGFRDRAIHDYYQIDLEIVWETIFTDIQLLENAIKDFLASE